jgi:hypothetical protein
MSYPMRSKQIFAGWALSTVAGLILLADAFTMLFAPEKLAQPMQETGFTPTQLPLIGAILVVGVVIYLTPRAALLGAIVLTGFLGGAICAHVRIGEVLSAPEVICLAIGLLVWVGLGLRDPTMGRRVIGAHEVGH